MLTPNIAIKNGNNYLFTHDGNILHLQSSGSYSKIILQDGQTHVIAKTLKELELKLPSNFMRVHRSHVININHVKSISENDGMKLTLSNKSLVPITKENKKRLFERFRKL